MCHPWVRHRSQGFSTFFIIYLISISSYRCHFNSFTYQLFPVSGPLLTVPWLQPRSQPPSFMALYACSPAATGAFQKHKLYYVTILQTHKEVAGVLPLVCRTPRNLALACPLPPPLSLHPLHHTGHHLVLP